MKLVRMLAFVGLAAIAAVTPLAAAEYEVQMLNKGADGTAMVFEPAFLQIQPGDTVKFVATDKGHNAEIINGMLPEGAEPFKGRINEEISVTFDVEGAYGYKCLPHLAMGMVGLIVVGDDPANLDAIRNASVPPRVAAKFEELIGQIGQ